MDTEGSLITRMHMHGAVSISLLQFPLEPFIFIYLYIDFFHFSWYSSSKRYFACVLLFAFFFLSFFLSVLQEKNDFARIFKSVAVDRNSPSHARALVKSGSRLGNHGLSPIH